MEQRPVVLGCDPELFLIRRGKGVIGSHEVVPAEGISCSRASVMRDGVQVEIHVAPSYSYAQLGSYIRTAFVALRERLGEYQLSFATTIELSQAVFDTLPYEARQLGCLRSENIYDPQACVDANPACRIRSCGGHIHIELSAEDYKRREELVPILDLIVGNTCVLFDRDPGSAIRRRLYGRAGEYRLPQHGVEYRVLSNFWLRAYPLMALVFKLTITAVRIFHHKSACAYLMRTMDFEKIRRAINQNDLTMAREIYGQWRHLDICTKLYGSPDLWSFVDILSAYGLEYWFPGDPLTHWCSLTDFSNTGW